MSLEAFLNKFNNPDGKYVYSIDPLKYFNVYVTFAHPSGGGSSGFQRAIVNVLNNATGGIAGKIINSSKNTMNKNGYGSISELAPASLIEDVSDGALDLTYFVQEGTLPSIKVLDSETSETIVGSLKTHKMAVETDSKEFSLKVLNTKVSILDRLFYPWMREISYPYWSYQDQPYETATIEISMASHNDISYVFLGARPISIESINPTNLLDTNMTRNVTFAFDFMYIKSQGKNIESIVDTIANTGKSIINKAISTIGL